MRFFPALLSAIAIPSVISTSIAARDYATLHAFCQASGPNVFFAARYAEGPPRGIEFGECLATRDPVRGPVLDGVLCKTGSCYASGSTSASAGPAPGWNLYTSR
ncbi:hypothetical protein BDZ94DRAFT_1309432 [Collybia nuda]|uniref:Uncharacterized protein n=1 Tax=Collybia nuda TaxID=64659 RepID=A0A9P5Y5R9_9AGAR|nr:hypothetical protein BDZ94DRAFT_1309432 [Collybia nuda]